MTKRGESLAQKGFLRPSGRLAHFPAKERSLPHRISFPIHKTVAFTFDADNLNVLGDCYNRDVVDRKTLGNFYRNAGMRLLTFLNKYRIPATHFVIGRDLEIKECAEYFQQCRAAGHEIANHTYSHTELTELTETEQKNELVLCHENIIKYTAAVPKGFRGGSMHTTPAVLNKMKSLGYTYDSSQFPSFWNSIFFMYLFLITRTKRNMPRLRHFESGFIRKEPYIETGENGKGIIRFPTTVVPHFQIPFYATFHIMYPWLFDITHKHVFNLRDIIVYQGHIMDFVDADKDNIPDYIKQYPIFRVPLSKRLEAYHKVVTKILSVYNADTLINLSEGIKL